MSASTTYMKFEMLRTVRNVRFFIFSFIFPLILYYVIAGSNRHTKALGVPFPVYFMTGMASWGAMTAVMAGGARISLERADGWTRQMRLTPLPARVYFRTKVLSGYFLALISIGVLFLAGLTLGVSLPGSGWAHMTEYIIIGLIPFAVLGILIGHLVGPDSMGPALGGVTSLFALLGGAWGPIGQSGALKHVVDLLPSYWLVQAGKDALTGQTWSTQPWIVVGIWTVVLLQLTIFVYRRDTKRL